MAAGQRRPPASLQRGLLGVLLVGRGEIMDGVLDHIPGIHGFLEAAGDALHRSAATWMRDGRVGKLLKTGEDNWQRDERDR